MKKLPFAIAAVAILVVLVFIVVDYRWFGLAIQNQVRPLEAITLATNLLIALYIQRFFTTRINDLRAEKNVLIDATKELIRVLSEVKERTDEQLNKPSIGEEDRTAILFGFRRIANAITDLQGIVSMSHLKSTNQNLTSIMLKYYELKSVATGDSFPFKGYSIRQRSSQDLLFRSLKTKCQRLIFEINEAQK